MTFPVPISWKTADIPTFGLEDEAWDDSELKRDAGGGGGAEGAIEALAFDGAITFPVWLHTGPKGWKLFT